MVESVLGAIHVEAGFETSRQAALNLLQPFLELLLREDVDVTQRLLRHPKHLLKDLGGKLVSVSNMDEAQYVRQHPQSEVWSRNHRQFVSAQRSKKHTKTTVDCAGVTILTVVADTESPSVHRACDLVLTVLDRNADLRKRFVEARRVAQRYEANHDDDDDEYESDEEEDDDIRIISS